MYLRHPADTIFEFKKKVSDTDIFREGNEHIHIHTTAPIKGSDTEPHMDNAMGKVTPAAAAVVSSGHSVSPPKGAIAGLQLLPTLSRLAHDEQLTSGVKTSEI